MPDRFASVRAVADAVLYEGYVLYPYRASSSKNQTRWQFGVLMPPGFDDASERSASRSELVLEARPGARLHLEVRFLHVQHRTGGGQPDWDETIERSVAVDVAVDDLRSARHERPFTFDAVESDDGAHREAAPVAGAVVLALAELPGPYGALRLRVDIENRTTAAPADRDTALRHALVAAHAVLAIDSGRFLSMTDPPEWARPEVAACTNDGAWPVLAGSEQLVLCSPIILGDHPEIAPESPGDLYDATEIDEILTLRTMTLTDAEKAEARATDPRAASVIDRVDALPPEHLDRLHGALRYLRRVESDGDERDPDEDLARMMQPETSWWDPGADSSVDPERDAVIVDGVRIARGSRVRLHPGARRTDAQDLFLRGRTATVEAVLFDVDGQQHLGVTPDEDPELAEIQRWHGRYLY
ncbi:MAG: hypothetical protein ACRDVG_04510, partial [Jatrophihabitantaceae bacterium]